MFKRDVNECMDMHNGYKLRLWLYCYKLPLQICTMPMMMMRQRARSFPVVNTSCTRVAQRTLKQLIQVNSTIIKRTIYIHSTLYCNQKIH